MPKPLRIAAAAAVAATSITLALPGTSSAIPTCPDEATRALCGDRIVPDALATASFLQFDANGESLADVLAAIEAEAPDLFEVGTLESWLGSSEFRSFGDRDVFLVRVTDEAVPQSAKKQVAISLSVHGAEAAGREGGIRYLEDLAIKWADPTATLSSGGNDFLLTDVMAETESWVLFGNPDGWAAGDLGNGIFNRGNDNGADLNRDLATIGWYDYTGGRGVAESEPEMRGWATFLESLPDIATAVDIHGELASANNAFSDLIYSAGQWDPVKQARVAQFAQDMIANVERYFDEEGVVFDEAFGLAAGIAPAEIPTHPANVATAYDIVGYDDSGFMGDYMGSLNDNEVIEIDVENFLSNAVPNNAWIGLLEQAHVAAVKGNMETTIAGAMYLRDVDHQVPPLGRVGYIFDPEIVTDADGVESSIDPADTQTPYAVTRMRYFEDLAATTGESVTPLETFEFVESDLSFYDTIVVSDTELPPPNADGSVDHDKATFAAKLVEFATGGGQVVLTDESVHLLDDMGIVDAADLSLIRTNAGHVDFDPDQDDPYKAGLFGLPSQTYYEVPVGFPAEDSAPHWVVDQAAWEAAGGTTVGTVDGDTTGLGRIDLGTGRVAIFGAILPQPSEILPDGTETPHPHGLANYAVTIAGGTVFHNILAYTRDGGTAVPEFPIVPAVGFLGMLLAVGAVRRRTTAEATA